MQVETNLSDKPKLYNEKTIYRTQKFAENADFAPSRATTASLNRPKFGQMKSTDFRRSSAHGKKENIDWSHLGEKIEDWFEYAKTPGNLKLFLNVKN